MTDTTPTHDAPPHAHAATIFNGRRSRKTSLFAGDDDAARSDSEGDTLDDAARDSKDYARQRLRDELGREPTDAETDEWLRDHTESY